MIVTKRRVARKAHRCDSCERPVIKPGHVYLDHVAFPGDDVLGWHATRPSRSKECSDCCYRYGRGDALDPIPEGSTQSFRYWLGDETPAER